MLVRVGGSRTPSGFYRLGGARIAINLRLGLVWLRPVGCFSVTPCLADHVQGSFGFGHGCPVNQVDGGPGLEQPPFVLGDGAGDDQCLTDSGGAFQPYFHLGVNAVHPGKYGGPAQGFVKQAGEDTTVSDA